MMANSKQPPKLTLYATTGVNPYKITIALEELKLPYDLKVLDVFKKEHKSDWFTAINPNGRLPALTDATEDGSVINLAESATILMYLADKYDPENKLNYPQGTKEYYEVLNWVVWQVSGLGPMQGQATHFIRYAYEKVPYGELRYLTETRRLYSVLDKHLASKASRYIVGDKFTIADISCFIWVYAAAWSGIDIDAFPAVKEWRERVGQKESVKKGLTIPVPCTFGDDFVKSESEESRVFKEKIQEGVTAWVKSDQEGVIEEYQKRAPKGK